MPPTTRLTDIAFRNMVADLEHRVASMDAALSRHEAGAGRGTPTGPYVSTDLSMHYSTDLQEIEAEADCDYVYVEPRADFDDAIIGHDPWANRLIYDEWLCVDVVMRTQDLGEEAALEHCAANIFTITELAAGPIFSTLVRRRRCV